MTHKSVNGKMSEYMLSNNIITSSNFVGTKCLVAQWANLYKNIGYDVININTNELLSLGAIPIAVSVGFSILKDTNIKIMKDIADGIREAAMRSNIAFIPGEVAQLPEILNPEFPGKTFNVIGFGIGIFQPSINKVKIHKGDIIIGIESNGLHCNGFALVRKVLIDKWVFVEKYHGYRVGKIFQPSNEPIEIELLRPTISYKPLLTELINEKVCIKGSANVTSKGITCLLKYFEQYDVGMKIDNFPEIPPIFLEIEKIGNIDVGEMFRVFNMGIGYYLIIDPIDKDRVLEIADKVGIKAYCIGEVDNDIKGILLHYKGNNILYRDYTHWDFL